LLATGNWRFAGRVIGVPQLVGLVCSAGLIATLSLLLKHTRFGRALRTIAEDSETALMLGVDINRVAAAVFVVAGLFAAFAGILFALNYRQVHPFMGEAVGLKAIAAMIVGGMGNIWGSIVGGLVIGLAEVFAIRYFGADFVDIAVFGLLLFILFVRPTGLFRGMQIARAGI
jgi:branched-chain amino acid transport system permease protein